MISEGCNCFTSLDEAYLFMEEITEGRSKIRTGLYHTEFRMQALEEALNVEKLSEAEPKFVFNTLKEKEISNYFDFKNLFQSKQDFRVVAEQHVIR